MRPPERKTLQNMSFYNIGWCSKRSSDCSLNTFDIDRQGSARNVPPRYFAMLLTLFCKMVIADISAGYHSS